MRSLMLSFALVAACASNKAAPMAAAPPNNTAEPGPSPCEALADKLQPLFAGEGVQPKVYRDIIAKRCATDGWAAEARACFDGVKSLDEADRCDKMLTKAQHDALQQDGKAVDSTHKGSSAPGKNGGDPCEGGE
jgi:hypothetical protein